MSRNIKYFIMDVDGTLTDGKVYIGADGEVMKAFDIKDGYGIHDILIPSGIVPVIITGRKSVFVENRCRELGIKNIFQGERDKLTILENFLSCNDSCFRECAYIGDDLNDLSCMEKIKSAGGIVGCPADSSEKIKQISNYVSNHNGGNGAVRDFIEEIYKLQHVQ